MLHPSPSIGTSGTLQGKHRGGAAIEAGGWRSGQLAAASNAWGRSSHHRQSRGSRRGIGVESLKSNERRSMGAMDHKTRSKTCSTKLSNTQNSKVSFLTGKAGEMWHSCLVETLLRRSWKCTVLKVERVPPWNVRVKKSNTGQLCNLRFYVPRFNTGNFWRFNPSTRTIHTLRNLAEDQGGVHKA